MSQAERKPDGNAIVIFAGRVGISQRNWLPAYRQRVRESLGVVAGDGPSGEIRLVDTEKIRIALLAKHSVQVVRGGNILQMLRVEVEQRLIQISEVVTADTGLPVLDLLAHGAVVSEETIG